MRQTNTYTFFFIIVIAVISSLVLSFASQSLSRRQALNIENDREKNILIALGLYSDGKCFDNEKQDYSRDEASCNVTCCYGEYVKSFAVDGNGNLKKSGDVPERIDLEKELEKPEAERAYPVFTRVINGNIEAYCIPVVGKGLWSTLYGYLALKNDLNTVAGLTFYKHGETPGLGAEIEKKWFQKDFVGKKILNEKNELVSVKVVKGKVKPNSPDISHEVDGISGATLTGNGVTKLLKKCLSLYEPYFKNIKKGVR